ncbi:PAS domain-containing protein [Candidatus Omnitrophota bacterium]
MPQKDKTKEELIYEIKLLQKQIAEFEITDIEHKKNEQVIKKAREYAESIVDTVREPLIVLGADLKIISANRSFYQIFKVNPEETVGHFIYDLGNKQWDIPKLRHLLENILPKKKCFENYKIEHNFETIGLKSMLLNARRLDSVEMILLAIEDITDLKETKNSLRGTRQHMEFILGVTKTGLDIIDSDFNVVYIDPEWQKIYGGYEGRKCYEYFMEKNKICTDCGVKKALKTKKPIVSEEVLSREDNRPVQVTTIPFQNEKGEWLVAEVNVDITERKKTEKEIRALARFPEENSNPVYRVSKDGILLYANPASRELILEDRTKIGNKIPEKWIKMIKNVYDSKKRQRVEAELSGRVFLFDLVPVIESGYINSYAIDITKRKNAEEDLRKAYSELEKEKKLLSDKNIAFQEIIKEIEIEKNRLKDDIIINVDDVIMPILKRIKMKGGVSRKYFDLLESSLKALIGSFGHRLIEQKNKLTPKEIEICNIVKSGLTTKEISNLLNISSQTTDKHRRNIRKKLGLAKKNINLTSFLQSL